ncbi:hypothetical protein CISG_09207 [Coccidioides immitis RMSCC 3703]|uniref:Uncharacterized protein n=1 Tax=Coccidioides immitis RMSCC 3703 TaxID=454286 RepID=A0A0J8R991_COCIT|nr:hypothetical protein CISG_09207 [Coccidioides immitis RMSCC 3703]
MGRFNWVRPPVLVENRERNAGLELEYEKYLRQGSFWKANVVDHQIVLVNVEAHDATHGAVIRAQTERDKSVGTPTCVGEMERLANLHQRENVEQLLLELGQVLERQTKLKRLGEYLLELRADLLNGNDVDLNDFRSLCYTRQRVVHSRR